jgi:hypothetical protein
MTTRFPEALRALISSYDRVSRELAELGIHRAGGVYIWTYQIDAPADVKRLPRLQALVKDGHAKVRRTDTGMSSWRPTPAGRAALAEFDRLNSPEYAQYLASEEAAAAAARQRAAVKEQLLARLADEQPHRLRKLTAEFGADLRPILEELVEAGSVRPIGMGMGWYILGSAADPVKPSAKLPTHAAGTAELLDALAVPRTVSQLVAILGKSRQAVWAQLGSLAARGLVKGPPLVDGGRRRAGVWRRVKAKSPDAKRAQ